MNAFEAIAIIRLSALGDIIHALPVANILRREYPASKISWIVDTRYQEILEGHVDIDEIIPIDTQRWKGGIAGIGAFLHDIRDLSKKFAERRFSLVLDLQGLMKSGILSAMTKAHKRVGFDRANCRESLNTIFNNVHIAPLGEDRHIIDKNLAFLRRLAINTQNWEWRIPLRSEQERFAEGFIAGLKIKDKSPLVGINPGAQWETKRWGVERYSILADRLKRELGAEVIWTWGPGEKPLVDEIRRRMEEKSIAAPPTTVQELSALTGRFDLFIGGDTGPLHLAVAVGVPTVSIYGPTDPARNGPYGQGHRVLYHELDCSGCHKRTCNNFRCLDPITVDDVFGACRQQLK